MTGLFSLLLSSGVMMLRYRQSSEPTSLPTDTGVICIYPNDFYTVFFWVIQILWADVAGAARLPDPLPFPRGFRALEPERPKRWPGIRHTPKLLCASCPAAPQPTFGNIHLEERRQGRGGD